MFDPYHKWLGIPKDQRPPTLFQLLGISPDETDVEVIEEAAIRQTTHVRTFQIGPHAEDCKRVLNELSVARQVLLNPDKRKAYKELLAKQAGKKAAAAPPTAKPVDTGVTPVPPAPEWNFDTAAPAAAAGKPPKPDAPRRRATSAAAPDKKSFFAASKTMLIAAGTCAGGLIVAVVALLVFRPAPQAAQRDNKPIVPIADAQKGQGTIGSEPKVEAPVKQKDAVPIDPIPKPEPKDPDPPKPEPPRPSSVALGTLPPPKLLSQKAGLNSEHVLAPDGSRVFGKHGKNAISERSISELELLKTHEIRNAAAVHSIGFGLDPRRLVVITSIADDSPAKQFRLWDFDANKETAIIDLPVGGTRAFPSTDGKMLVVFLPTPQQFITYDITNGRELKRWSVTQAKLDDRPSYVISSDGYTLVTRAAGGNALYYLNVMTGEEKIQNLIDPTPIVNPSAISRDGTMMIAHLGGGNFRQLMLHPFKPGFKIHVSGNSATNFNMSPDNRFALQGVTRHEPAGDKSHFVMYDLKDGSVLSVSEPIPEEATAIFLAPNGIAFIRDNFGIGRVYQFALPPDYAVANKAPAKTTIPITRPTRIPLPDPQAISVAETAIRAQYKKEYAKKTPADNAALAEKFLQLGLDTADDMAQRYVLYSEARDLAVKAGQPALALKIVGELSDAFDVDATALKTATLTGLAKTTGPASAVELVEMGLAMATEKVGLDQYEAAVALLAALQPAAQRSKNPVLIGQVQRFEKQVKETSKEFEEVKKANAKLEQDPLNAEASASVGMFLAFRKGDWDKGLTLLAQSKTDLEPLAKSDLAKPADPKDKVELGNSWWKASEKKPAYQKAAMQWRAGYWYRQALPDVSGIVKDKAQERLKLVDEQPLPFVSASALGEVQRLKHKAAVTWMTVAPDGKRVFSSSMDGMIREWHLATGAQRVILNPQQSIAHFSLAPDERHLALGSPAGFTIWDLATLRPVPFAKTEKEAVQGLYWKDAGSILATSKTSFSQWNVNGTGNSGPLSPGKVATGRALVVSPKGDVSVVLCDEGQNILFNTAGGARFPRGEIVFPAYAAAFSPDSRHLALGGKDGTVRLYDTKNTASFQTFTGHAMPVRTVAIAPDGSRLLSGGDDKAVKVWDVSTRAELHSYNLHIGPIRVVAFTTDGRHALSASMDGTIRMWSLPK